MSTLAVLLLPLLANSQAPLPQPASAHVATTDACVEALAVRPLALQGAWRAPQSGGAAAEAAGTADAVRLLVLAPAELRATAHEDAAALYALGRAAQLQQRFDSARHGRLAVDDQIRWTLASNRDQRVESTVGIGADGAQLRFHWSFSH